MGHGKEVRRRGKEVTSPEKLRACKVCDVDATLSMRAIGGTWSKGRKASQAKAAAADSTTTLRREDWQPSAGRLKSYGWGTFPSDSLDIELSC